MQDSNVYVCSETKLSEVLLNNFFGRIRLIVFPWVEFPWIWRNVSHICALHIANWWKKKIMGIIESCHKHQRISGVRRKSRVRRLPLKFGGEKYSFKEIMSGVFESYFIWFVSSKAHTRKVTKIEHGEYFLLFVYCSYSIALIKTEIKQDLAPWKYRLRDR